MEGGGSDSEAPLIHPEKIRKVQKIYEEKVRPIHMRYLYRHKYFQNHSQYPFDHLATERNLNNAWWLAEFATLSTTDPEFVKKNLQKVGLEVRFFYGEKTDAESFVAWNQDLVMVAFRGTETLGLTDWMTDAKFNLAFWPYGGRVHKGFRNSFFDLWITTGLKDFIRSRVAMLPAESKMLWLTGHSLGAALSTLAADAYEGECQVYNFGSPRVGDQKFQEGFSKKTYRFVNHLDIVTNLPPYLKPLLPYFHIGELNFLDKDGEIKKESSLSSLEILGMAGFWDKIIESTVVRLFLDHVPTFYIEKIKKNLPTPERAQ